MALLEAADNGSSETVQILLAAGADVHARMNAPLRYAARYGELDVVRMLLHAGADPHAENDYALRYALENEHFDIVKLLMPKPDNISMVFRTPSECVVCMTYSDAITDCGHYVCEKCVLSWMSLTCPSCRHANCSYRLLFPFMFDLYE